MDRGEADFFLGALVLNLIVAELAVVLAIGLVILATRPDTPWSFVSIAGVAAAVVVPVITYPMARMCWLALDLRLRPPGDDTSPVGPFDVS